MFRSSGGSTSAASVISRVLPQFDGGQEEARTYKSSQPPDVSPQKA